jgi:hypothetical protein
MKKLLIALLVSLAPALALSATWEKVSLVDQKCSEKMKANPDKHPTSCLLKCADSGYGVITKDGTFLKLDEKGNQTALAALKTTKKTDGVRVNVKGEQKGNVIQVESLSIPD